MNYPMIGYIIGNLLKVEAGLLLLPSLVVILYREDTLPAFGITILILLALGLPLSWRAGFCKSLD